MNEIIALAPTGQLTSGFPEESFDKGLRYGPDFIGVDSGTTDVGPHYLGSGVSMGSRDAMKRYVTTLLRGARKNEIPLIIGSAGTSGGEPHLFWLESIVKEVASNENIRLKMAIIHSEQSKDLLKKKLAQDKIIPLNPWGFKVKYPISAGVIDNCERIVGVMGAEPYMLALKEGAQVIIAGRSTDTAIFAALPLLRGLPPGPVWHAAKILECGAAAVEQRPEDECLMARITSDYFEVWPPNERLKCTPVSVRSHMFYENPSPFKLYEPSGMLDTSKALYEEIVGGRVRVRGSEWEPAKKYTVKLEGVRRIGYRSIFVAGIRDPVLINEIDDFIKRAQNTIRSKVRFAYPKLAESAYQFILHIYGKNGVMGPLEPIRKVTSHEISLLGEVVAPTEDLSYGICYIAYRVLLHQHYGWFSGLQTGLASPFSPEIVKVGVAYAFSLNHLVQPKNPNELFRLEILDR